MILAPSTIQMSEGFVPSIILNGQSEFTLEGCFDDEADALAVAVAAIEGIRADQRAALPAGYEW